jgi:hypothetical protein
MNNSIRIQIENLMAEAIISGDIETASMCRSITHASLYGSDTAKVVSPNDLGCNIKEYVQAINESIHSPQPEGHVICNGFRVYAQW